MNTPSSETAVWLVGHTPVAPMSMGIEHAGEGTSTRIAGAIEVPRNIKAWVTLEVHFLDCVSVTFHAIENLRLERGFFREGH